MIMQRIAKRAKSKKGQGSVEYIMLIAVVVAVIFAFKGVIVEKIQKVTTTLFTTVEQGITDAAK